MKWKILLVFDILMWALIFLNFINIIHFEISGGDSMLPKVHNSMSMCIKQSRYNVGDIVTYRSNWSVYPNTTIEHRIISELSDEGEIFGYVIAGDNPDQRLIELVPKRDIICKDVFWINMIK